ncbi:polysaccharide deacetylase family protein [Halorubellus sp. PRR65]|uniref:polysaccharide deacetylase family protein n=1 Tax=Halorubellus sp. PRR65 TaxID=3098148 RepID=UPI002B25B27A|nr:polysaccharide deacetylase family protein [Halorubellus sp. PRR65]
MGSVVFSLDAELAWGFPDFASLPMDRVDASRDAWSWLVDLFDEYDVPATWAVVGHLFLEDCDARHADLDAPDGWFAHESGALAGRHDVRFAPDLVAAVRNADVAHDVGSHSFAHVPFDHPETTRELVDADLGRAVAVAADQGVVLESFVFPRNAVGFRDLLAKHGFRTYRSAGAPTGTGLARAARKIAAVVDPGRVPLVEPRVDEYGLVDLPPSLFLFGFEGRARDTLAAAWTDPIVRQATDAIDRAAAGDGVCHLWLHPNNVVDDAGRARLEAIVAHVARRRDQDGLVVETMRDVADRVLETEPTTTVA